MDAYGLTLGKPLDLPLCPTQGAVGYVRPQSGACHHPESDGKRTILFSASEWPSEVRRIEAALDSGGALNLLNILPEAVAQDLVLEQLVRKYGRPKTRGTIPMQNAFGAQFSAITATWESHTLRVEFIGMLDRNVGSLLIGTPAAIADHKVELERKARGTGRRL